MAVSADGAATEAGREILAAGGNAVDAAVAVHFALAVVRPRAGNLGGGGFLIYRSPDGSEVALDFREEAPGAATGDMFLDEEGNVTGESWTGHLAAGVPGSVAGMAEAHRRFGTLPWSRVLRPALELARDGFRVDSAFHAGIASEADRLGRFPASAAKWLPGGDPPEMGTTFRQPELARVLRAVSDSGPGAFYRGWIADSIAAEMRRGGGLVDRDDLAAYEAVWRDPVRVDYRGRRIVSMPPPSSGGVTLAEIFHVVDGFDLDSAGFGSADAVHVAVEAFRRAYADRNFHLGDPDFVEMPLERLTSPAYGDSLAASIRMDRASSSERFRKVPAPDSLPESRETTHFSVVDAAGGAVAVTTTLNGFFGSAVTVPGTGMLLNNEMDDFTAKPGVPNQYGLVQGRANAVAPGKRMLSSMSPTIVVGSDGSTELVTGTPGGSTIITTVFQVVSNHVDHGMSAAAAVRAPRFHHQHLPDVVRFEPGGLEREVVEELRRRGHRVEVRSGTSGNVQSIRIRPDGTRVGVPDPRGTGTAAGTGAGEERESAPSPAGRDGPGGG
jgi:gamma-glutamyltranspeptidase/glutathione hydrolase